MRKDFNFLLQVEKECIIEGMQAYLTHKDIAVDTELLENIFME